MLKEQQIHVHEGIFSSYENSDIVVFGVPFDGTVSFRPGTRFGPIAVRQELDGLETFSPYQNKDLVDYKICDLGDIELPFGNTKRVMETVNTNVLDMLKDNKKTLAIGGEHLVSYPIIKSYIEEYKDLHIIHFDAHADLREDYLGEQLSHATVMRRVYDEVGVNRIWQFGIRSGTREEFDFAKNNTSITLFTVEGVRKALDKIGDKPIYVSIDLDVLDPSIFAGTGTPEPGGVSFSDLIKALLKLKGCNIVGADVVELAPHYDQSGVSTAVACKVLREMLLLMTNPS